MSDYPRAIQKRLPQDSKNRPLKPRSVVMHTTTSGNLSPYKFFASAGAQGVESHYWVSREGDIYQFMSTDHVADCQLGGNAYAISIETADSGVQSNLGPWNAAQLAAITGLVAWLCKKYDIPPIKATAWNGKGIGYHAQFTKSFGNDCWNHSHSCPAASKIAQMPTLITAVKKAVTAPTPPTGGGTTITTGGDQVPAQITGDVAFPTKLTLGPNRKTIPLVDKNSPSILSEDQTGSGALRVHAGVNISFIGLTGDHKVFGNWVLFDDSGKRLGMVKGTQRPASAGDSTLDCVWPFTLGKNRRLRFEAWTNQPSGVAVTLARSSVHYWKA